MAAIDDLNGLLEILPGYAKLSSGMKTSALGMSLIPDSDGVWPGQPLYVPTYDIYWAAIQLIGFLQAQPFLRQTSSEGTSVAMDAPDWSGILAFYRSMSPIVQASGGSVLTRVAIPDPPHVVRTDMSGRGSSYGDIDTDIS